MTARRFAWRIRHTMGRSARQSCIKTDGFCVIDDEFCIKDDGFCIFKMMDFVFKGQQGGVARAVQASPSAGSEAGFSFAVCSDVKVNASTIKSQADFRFVGNSAHSDNARIVR